MSNLSNVCQSGGGWALGAVGYFFGFPNATFNFYSSNPAPLSPSPPDAPSSQNTPSPLSVAKPPFSPCFPVRSRRALEGRGSRQCHGR